MSKIQDNLGQLSTLTANSSRTGPYIEKRKQTSLRAIPAELDKKIW